MARAWAVAAAAVVLVLCASPVLSARLPDPFEGDSGAWGQHLDVGQNLNGWLSSRKHDENGPKSVAFRYLVPTRDAKAFVEEWRKLEKSVRKESGNVVFDLKKTLTDNIIFVSYAEWESPKGLGAHVEGKALHDFLTFLADRDIVVKMEPLFSGCDKEEKRPEKKGDTDPVAILSKWIVRPHVQKEFIKAFEDTVEAAHNTKGNRVYSLKKVLTDNLSFYLYSSWDKFEDFADFLKSKDTRDFAKFVEENDIVFFTSPLKKLGDQPE